MGIPHFFSWLSRQCPAMLQRAHEAPSPQLDTSLPNLNGVEFDSLYLDLNGIIHPCCHPKSPGVSRPTSESEMISSVFSSIDRIFSIVRPRRLLFLAVDGVAPRAKLNQQRARRFRASQDSCVRSRNEEEAGLVLPEVEFHWDSNAITPGTMFMGKLAAGVLHYVNGRVSRDPGWRGVRVVVSSSGVPGEGEHKIMEFLRRQRESVGYDPNMIHCMYGADADLIMLTLATHEPRFWVVRETPRPKGKIRAEGDSEFVLVSIAVVREWLSGALGVSGVDFERAVDDWVCLGYLCGNDFLLNVPSLHIDQNAMQQLTRAYSEALPGLGGFMTENGILDVGRLMRVLERLAEREPETLRTLGRENDPLRMGEPGYVERYYESKLKEKGGGDLVARRELCVRYMEGLSWVMRYYFQGCPSWSLYFLYHYAPLLQDVVSLVPGVSQQQFSFDLGRPFRPFEQLMVVLPAASSHLLPECLRRLMTDESSPIHDLYPESFEIDLDGKSADYEAVVLLPFIDEGRLRAAMKMARGCYTAEERACNCRSDRLLLLAHQETLDAVTGIPMGVCGSCGKKSDTGVVFPAPWEGLDDVSPTEAVTFVFLQPEFKEGHVFHSGILPGMELPAPMIDELNRDPERSLPERMLRRLKRGCFFVVLPGELLFHSERWSSVKAELEKWGEPAGYAEVKWQLRQSWLQLRPLERAECSARAEEMGVSNPTKHPRGALNAQPQSRPSGTAVAAPEKQQPRPFKRSAVEPAQPVRACRPSEGPPCVAKKRNQAPMPDGEAGDPAVNSAIVVPSNSGKGRAASRAMVTKQSPQDANL